MITDKNIEITDEPKKEDVQLVLDGLDEYNYSHAKRDVKELGIFIRENGRVIAGLYGHSFGDWTHIKYFWVAGSQRNKRLGTKLMSLAEEEARNRGCIGIHLDTYSFQALDFYRKLGFEVLGEIQDHPKGETRYYLLKRL